MHSRIIAGSLFVLGLLATGALATSGDDVAPSRQWAIVNFSEPVLVTDQMLMGPYLIVHDDSKMRRGLPCTSFYRFDPDKGPQEAVVGFHCVPVRRSVADHTVLVQTGVPALGVKRLVEYQFSGDTEGHRIPISPTAPAEAR
jgi:hypothetical protein